MTGFQSTDEFNELLEGRTLRFILTGGGVQVWSPTQRRVPRRGERRGDRIDGDLRRAAGGRGPAPRRD
jgi:hypothetical protein